MTELKTAFPFRTLVLTLLCVAFLGLLLAYILWQARFLIQGPQLELTEVPPEHSNERIVHIGGQAKNIAKITLNGRQIFTDPHGDFREALVLENGYTVATIAATDRYGRTTAITRPYIYTPASILTE